ncbi:hypothetical protein [Insolitispirillum peregrinum]|uniref:hypothetical protein n=1 Tax=Insolitispirillum peregrinum TaxID=80876 RepID=UPI00360CE5FB
MKRLLSDKRVYFAIFGAIGGVLSAVLYDVFGLEGAFGSWVVGTGFDGMCIAAMLAFGQARYVGKSFDAKSFRKAMMIGGIGGLIGGFIALQFGFPLARLFGGSVDAGRFLGWSLGGAAVGFAVSRIVPNLKMTTACLSGAAGGLVGCALMYLMHAMAAGTATTGAAIGVAIALAESAFRQAWLEITIRPKGLTLEKERTLTVTLGDKPVLFGCSGDADVKLAEMEGARAHFARVSLSAGKITLHDMISGTTRTVAVDETFDISNAQVVVRSKT